MRVLLLVTILKDTANSADLCQKRLKRDFERLTTFKTLRGVGLYVVTLRESLRTYFGRVDAPTAARIGFFKSHTECLRFLLRSLNLPKPLLGVTLARVSRGVIREGCSTV